MAHTWHTEVAVNSPRSLQPEPEVTVNGKPLAEYAGLNMDEENLPPLNTDNMDECR